MLEKFITENLYRTESFINIPAKEVYERYELFCMHYKIPTLGKKAFYSQLELFGVVREPNNSRKKYKGWYIAPCRY